MGKKESHARPLLKAELRPQELHQEFRLWCKYIIREKPLPCYTQRYIAACQKLLVDCPPSKVLPLIIKRPGLIGALDSACGVLRPQDELRQKLLIASAILEAGPHYTAYFLPRRQSVPRLLLNLSWNGLLWLIKLSVGLVIMLILLDRWQANQGLGAESLGHEGAP